MKKLMLMLSASLLIISVLTSCRDPLLEGAFVDFNAGRFDKAMVLALEATEKNPNNSEAWCLLGKLQGKKDLIKEMMESFGKSLAIDTKFANDIEQEKSYYFQTSFNNGAKNYNVYNKSEDKKSEKAVKALNEAIKNFSNADIIKKDFKTINLLATCCSFLDDKNITLENYLKLTKSFPDSAASWFSLGNYYFSEKEYNKSAESINKSLEIDPKNIEAISLLSQIYDILKDFDNAVSTYKKAIEINPEEKAFHFNLGLLYFRASSDSIDENLKKSYYDEALICFDKSIALDPTLKDGYLLKGRVEIQLKKYEDGKNTSLKGLEQFPEDAGLWSNLYICYANLKEKEKAEEAYEKAKEFGGE